MSKSTLVRWSGLSLIVAGVMIALATIIHPSNESVSNILAQESRLIIGHWLYTFYTVFLLLGLSGVYFEYSKELGRLGLAGFLLTFIGCVFYAVSSDYGFTAPVLARLAPQTLQAINAYPPVVAMDVLMIVCIFFGFILLGVAVWRSKVLPAWSGLMIAIGWPLYLIMGAFSLMIYEPLWVLVIFSAALTGAGLAWIGYSIWSGDRQAMLQAEGC